MEVEVNIEAEDFDKLQIVHTGTAYVTLVALDDKGKPTEVPKLVLKTKQEEERYSEGEIRMETRLRNRKSKNK
jgi:acyl-CoA hydrolase